MKNFALRAAATDGVNWIGDIIVYLKDNTAEEARQAVQTVRDYGFTVIDAAWCKDEVGRNVVVVYVDAPHSVFGTTPGYSVTESHIMSKLSVETV